MPHPWDEKWDIKENLGSGGQGVTRLAVSKIDDQQGVLKKLKNNRSMTSRTRMSREVLTLEQMHQLGARVPSVIDHNTQLHSDGKTELYLVMEYISGSTVKDYITNRSQLSLDDAITATLSLCEVLRVGHSEGLLHRDIKPDNLIFQDDKIDSLYVVDYGLAFNSSDNEITQPEETFRNKFLDLPENNTPGGNMRDHRSDVTSACAVFYFLLTGHAVGQLQNESGLLPHKRPGYMVRDVIGDDSRCSRVEMILNRGLSPTLSERFQSIEGFMESLNAIEELDSTSQRTPIDLAKELSEQIAEGDRKTQIAAMEQIAYPLLNQLDTEIDRKYTGKLDRFSLQKIRRHDGNLDNTEYDSISETSIFTLSVQLHPQRKHYHLKFFARESQLIACSGHTEFDTKKSIPAVRADKWKEIAWFSQDSHEGLTQTVMNDFENWLSTSMQSLTNKITTG